MNELIKRPGFDILSMPIREIVEQVNRIMDPRQARRIAIVAEAVIQDKKSDLRILEHQAAKETRPGKLAHLRDLIKGSLEGVNKAVFVKTLYRRRAGELLPPVEEMSKGGGYTHGQRKSHPSTELTGDPSAADLGFNREVVARLRRLSAASEKVLEAWYEEKTKRGVELSSKLVDLYAMELLARNEPGEITAPSSGRDYKLILGDFRTAKIADNSIDVIVTDPPYVTGEREYLKLYSDLSLFAARVLKPGGSLFCMSGQLFLFQVMRGLGMRHDPENYLRYHWMIAIVMSEAGQCSMINSRNVNTLWKPLFWYTKGEASYDHIETTSRNPKGTTTQKWVGDVVRGGKRPEQEFHLEGWQQSDETMNEIVKKYTKRGSLICDPMMGSGTTGLAAIGNGRRFCGVEIVQAQFNLAKLRMEPDDLAEKK